MRTVLALLLTLASVSELEFDIVSDPGRAKRGVATIPVTVTIPVDQLRFVDDGAELVARFSIRANDRVIDDEHRVAAPRGTEPQGTVTYRFDVVAPIGSTVPIVITDLESGSSGTRLVVIAGKTALVDEPADDIDAEERWREVLAEAQRDNEPIVVFFRSRLCARCREFERVVVPHPTIQRRLPKVAFAILPSTDGEASVALFDRNGTLRARWPIVPDTTNFGIILDSVAAVAPQFVTGRELDAAIGLARLGRVNDARAMLERLRDDADPETRQSAIVAGAVLDANEGKSAQALAQLEPIAANAVTPKVAAEAQNAIEAIRAAGSVRAPQETNAIRILPLARQVVSGRQIVRTHVALASVARVVFSLDGREVARVDRPPYSATLDFGDVPERRAIRAVAFNRKGQELGRAERIVNEAGETFWLRLMSPREEWAGGATRVRMDVRVPSAHRVRRVVVSWNDAERVVLTAAPWERVVDIPEGQIGVLRAVAELDDGRTTEDAVLLNAGGMVDRVDVQLVELPITVVSRSGVVPEITPERITVREGKKVRRVESIATAAETALTVGLLIDVSDSMQKSLPDLQEAAIRFLETILGERDRAFLVTFDSRARLVQPATSDVALLRKQIMAIRPDGLTALHDAMVLGLLQFEGIKGRRAMIVFTDGLDIASEHSASDVSELARRVNVPVHVFASVPSGTEFLERIARTSGGTAHTLSDLAELPNVYARIEAALRAQILAFVRTEAATRENDWRGVTVAVDAPDVEVFAPAGYYATW